MAWNEWERSPRAEGLGLETDALVDALASDPTTKPDLFVLVGLIGKAPEVNVWRIYVNWALSEFYEIHEDHILYLLPADDDRWRVWVAHGSPVRHVAQETGRAEEAAFLTGGFADRADWTGGWSGDEGWGPAPTYCSDCRTPRTRCR